MKRNPILPCGLCVPICVRLAKIMPLYSSFATAWTNSSSIRDNAYFEAFNEEDPNARENACRLTSLRWEERNFPSAACRCIDDSFETSLSTLIQTLRQEKQTSRADISDDMEQQMDILLMLFIPCVWKMRPVPCVPPALLCSNAWSRTSKPVIASVGPCGRK